MCAVFRNIFMLTVSLVGKKKTASLKFRHLSFTAGQMPRGIRLQDMLNGKKKSRTDQSITASSVGGRACFAVQLPLLAP